MKINYHGYGLEIKYSDSIGTGTYHLEIMLPSGHGLVSKTQIFPKDLRWLDKRVLDIIPVTFQWRDPCVMVTFHTMTKDFIQEVDIQEILTELDRGNPGWNRYGHPYKEKSFIPPGERFCIFREAVNAYSYVRVEHEQKPLPVHGTYTGWDVRGSEKEAEQICCILDDLSDAYAIASFIKLMGLEKSS